MNSEFKLKGNSAGIKSKPLEHGNSNEWKQYNQKNTCPDHPVLPAGRLVEGLCRKPFPQARKESQTTGFPILFHFSTCPCVPFSTWQPFSNPAPPGVRLPAVRQRRRFPARQSWPPAAGVAPGKALQTASWGGRCTVTLPPPSKLHSTLKRKFEMKFYQEQS